MDFETIKKIFVEKKKVVFRLYSMEYVIEQCDDNRIVMYAEQYKMINITIIVLKNYSIIIEFIMK